MSLFDTPITFTLNDQERESFHGVTVKHEPGGAQNFYHWLARRLSKTGEITLEDSELRKLRRYAYEYGTGGYEGAFRAVLRAAWRAGWDKESSPPEETRPDAKGRAWDGRN